MPSDGRHHVSDHKMLPQGITYHLYMVFVEEAVLEEAIFAPFSRGTGYCRLRHSASKPLKPETWINAPLRPVPSHTRQPVQILQFLSGHAPLLPGLHGSQKHVQYPHSL